MESLLQSLSRFADTLNTIRYSGFRSQQNYAISSTSTAMCDQAYPILSYFGAPGAAIPSTSNLAASQQAIYEVASNLKASAMYQAAGSIERALPGRTTMTINVTDSRGVHDMREEQINAINPCITGYLPYPSLGNIYLYSDSGLYKELQVITSVNTRVNFHISLNGYYAWTDYHTNANGVPSNEYNTNQDWGRAAIPGQSI